MNYTYRVEGCPYLLVSMSDIKHKGGVLRVGEYLFGKKIKYEITHIFHDCVAIKEVK